MPTARPPMARSMTRKPQLLWRPGTLSKFAPEMPAIAAAGSEERAHLSRLAPYVQDCMVLIATRPGEHRLLDLVEAIVELVHLGEDGIDGAVDDFVNDAVGAGAQGHALLQRTGNGGGAGKVGGTVMCAVA